ncbi:cytochrome P450 [Agromyces aurantiacus]|uniref:Cytochrome P450 n=1 Tax=Agromyces aurantiacus TaxID=165814 RepID=A0ABV9R3A4_9MICO|nr:cytochrome P450 [Agromyces aurantiacus]MBM7502974.1 fatty-acid peroxygenase [Agromyces aurantiacus]
MSGTRGSIPRSPAFDDTLAFVRSGYLYGTRRFRTLGADAFEARLGGRKAVVVHGREAASVFYEGDRFSRERAMPTSVQHLLQDEGSVQALEGLAHHHRKSMFMRMLDEPHVLRLVDEFDLQWARVRAEHAGHTVPLYDLGNLVLTRAALAWAGVPAGTVDDRELAGRLAAMVDAAATIGAPNWIARSRRRRAEAWAAALVADVRAGTVEAGEHTAIRMIADGSDHHGAPLPEEVAAVEVLNVLRPIVAVSRFLVFAVHALHTHPAWEPVLAEDAAAATRFANEVRRFYPFFPVIAGTARRDFDWHGRNFEPGERVILDLYATNHDPRNWAEPRRFLPERFERWDGDPNTLVPQGGGDAATGHRCPGEAATIALTARFARLAASRPFEVPEQDLRISLRHIPALPMDRMRVTMRA